jgi:DNA-binding transcriptional LysR family regulator
MRVATIAKANPERGRLRLAAVTTAGEHIVPPLLAGFRRAHPEVEVVLEVGNRRRVWELLDHRGADLGIGGRPPLGGRLTSLAETDNELVVVSASPEGHPLAIRRVTVADLARQTWLVRESGSGTASTAVELFDDVGIDPATLVLGSNGAIRESVMVGLGIALISRAAVVRELAEGSLEEWRTVGPSSRGHLPLLRQWHLVGRGDEELPATAALFCEHVIGARHRGWARQGAP